MEGGVHKPDISAFRECLSLSWKNPYVLRLAFSAGIGGLLFGYDTGTTFSYVSITCYQPLVYVPCFVLFFVSLSP